MAEKKFDAQVNYGWGLSLNMTGKAPAVAKRIFDTYADALAYANDVNDSAIEGLVLSVVADDATKNGLYFVKQVATKEIEEQQDEEGNVIVEGVAAKEAILVKISTNADSQATADEVQELLNAEISARTEADTALSEAISANTEAIEVLSGAIDTNKDALDVVSGLAETNKTDIEVLSGAIDTNKDALDVVSGLAETNKTDIATVSGKVDNLLEVAIPEFQSNIKNNADAISAITTTYKIKEVVDNDLILSVDGNGKLSSELGIKYENNEIKLVGIDGKQIGNAIDATDFIADGMLSGVTLDKKEGEHTKMVFTFNTGNSAQTISLDVEEFLNADEVKALENSLLFHKGDMIAHVDVDEHNYIDAMMQKYSVSQLDDKFNTINSALTANTEVHTTLAQDIASANTRIDTVIEDLAELTSANTEAHEALSEAISANTTAIETLTTANTEAHTVLSGAISANTTAIEALATANTEAHEALSEAISANTTAIETLTTANTEAHTVLSGAIDTNAEAIETLTTANTEAHTVLSGAIDTNAEAIEILDAKVKENEEVVAAALVDLKATKVSSIVAEEGSNLVVNEVKDDNGISYTIGFQWLTF